MTDELKHPHDAHPTDKHPADAPEQEITSDAADLLDHPSHAELKEGPPIAVSPEAIQPPEEDAEAETAEAAFTAPGAPAPKLERLQKILAQAGVASRRHAEEMITQGRVQVNGQTVNVLGSKADPARDHIRVDGKLLHGAERLRYFVLNKPKGFVTTVSDPEGRPTVMQFFAKHGERLYPVGRLDYQSEGLLLVTNDGDLAHRLTKAASGVEKTYLVKVAGQPSEDALERLRRGVPIERDKPGSSKVLAAPVQVRPVRAGDNPWYEVILTEGRNRELRKMFEEIGHHVEKIRRVGYGPLVLDLEPGKVRELDAEELHALQLTAEGKLKPRRPKASHMLPKEAGQSTEQRIAKAERARRKFPPHREERPRTGRPFTERGPNTRPDQKRSDFGKVRGERGSFAGRERSGFPVRKDARSSFNPRPESQRTPSGPGEKPGFVRREKSGFPHREGFGGGGKLPGFAGGKPDKTTHRRRTEPERGASPRGERSAFAGRDRPGVQRSDLPSFPRREASALGKREQRKSPDRLSRFDKAPGPRSGFRPRDKEQKTPPRFNRDSNPGTSPPGGRSKPAFGKGKPAESRPRFGGSRPGPGRPSSGRPGTDRKRGSKPFGNSPRRGGPHAKGKKRP